MYLQTHTHTQFFYHFYFLASLENILIFNFIFSILCQNLREFSFCDCNENIFYKTLNI